MKFSIEEQSKMKSLIMIILESKKETEILIERKVICQRIREGRKGVIIF